MKNKLPVVALVAFAFLIVISLIIGFGAPRQQVQGQEPMVTRSPLPPWYPRKLFRQRREPEYRGPPFHNYKPPDYQQMGVLTGNGGEILPLYGKASSTNRDRYNYYSSTPGQQIYPLPISIGGRDCTEDIGCNELYGNEQVNVTGIAGTFNVNAYRTKTFT